MRAAISWAKVIGLFIYDVSCCCSSWLLNFVLPSKLNCLIVTFKASEFEVGIVPLLLASRSGRG